jgi:hypothetical protein
MTTTYSCHILLQSLSLNIEIRSFSASSSRFQLTNVCFATPIAFFVYVILSCLALDLDIVFSYVYIDSWPIALSNI